MRILFATDHAGFEMKNALLAFVRDELAYEVEDLGAHVHDPQDDYPDFIMPAARRVSEDPDGTRAIILGGSGQGEAMAANRFAHVRAAVYYGGSDDIVRLSRVHNDTNVLSLGARFLSLADAKAAVTLWLATEKDADPKYARRIEKVENETTLSS